MFLVERNALVRVFEVSVYKTRSSAVAVIADRTLLANDQIGFGYKFTNCWYA